MGRHKDGLDRLLPISVYSTGLVRDITAMIDDKSRLAQQGYQSKLAHNATDVQPDVMSLAESKRLPQHGKRDE